MKRKTQQTVMGYTFMLPIFLFYSIFLVIPLGFSLVLSFSEWGGFDLSLIRFVGWRNYEDLFSPWSDFLDPILWNTFYYAFGTVFFSFVAALTVAYLVTKLRFQAFWRTMYFLPTVTTVVAIGNVWSYLYHPHGGMINGLLNALGIPTIRFLANPNTALPAIVVVGAWAGIGAAVLILTAGIKAIPETYYEAAMIEGASEWRLFFNITLPLLKPSILFVLITGLIGGLQSFTLIMVMTGDGGPGNSTNVAALEMYNQAFRFGNWGLASAMAYTLFIVVFVITVVQLFLFRRGGVESY